MGKSKTPVVAVKIANPKREPRVAVDGENSQTKYPIWCVAQMDFEGPWPWTVSAQKLREIHGKLADFEKMLWSAISGTQNHFLSVESVNKKALKRLQELGHDDAADLLYSLRLSGKERVVGIRAGREFRILWWDPEHDVCPSSLKHT